jgi:transposase
MGATALEVPETEKTELRRWVKAPSTPQGIVMRAKIVLLASEGRPNLHIARELSVGRPTVLLWRERFEEGGLPALREIKEGRGRKRMIGDGKVEEIVKDTLTTTPPDATHWSLRTMAGKHDVSHVFIKKVWDAAGLRPHLVKTFKLSNDPQFIEKLRDVVGLYLSPPEHALVLSIDEKSQIQALDRTQRALPLARGRKATVTHDYKRNGTTTLFAALDILKGEVIGSCMPRHRHQEFLKFLKKIDAETDQTLDIHCVLDNYGTHKHEKVRNWLAKHQRFHLHFIPTSSSWLNLVERWFGEITRKRIRRGVFRSVDDLIAAIDDYVLRNNKNPRPFVWTKSADDIIEKVERCKAILRTGH